MGRLALLAALVVAAAALSSLSASAAGAVRQSTARASLELVSLEPLRVRGERFRAWEAVRVTARLDGQTTVARGRAGRRGVFVVALRTTPGACIASVRLVAVGARGTRAELAFDHVACAPTS